MCQRLCTFSRELLFILYICNSKKITASKIKWQWHENFRTILPVTFVDDKVRSIMTKYRRNNISKFLLKFFFIKKAENFKKIFDESKSLFWEFFMLKDSRLHVYIEHHRIRIASDSCAFICQLFCLKTTRMQFCHRKKIVSSDA